MENSCRSHFGTRTSLFFSQRDLTVWPQIRRFRYLPFGQLEVGLTTHNANGHAYGDEI